MKSLLAAAVATSMSIAAASAQTATLPGSTFPGTAAPPSAFGADPIIQITTTFQARIEGLTDPREVPSTTAQDTARRQLYNMAANECIVLAEYWKAECRLSSLEVYASLQVDMQPQVPSMFATAVYELKLTPPRR